MVSSCSAVGCTNRGGSKPGLFMKRIPSDEKLRKIWLNKIKRVGNLHKKIYLCSDHFTQDCFERDLKRELLNDSTVPVYKLKEDPIPTVFSYSKATPERVASDRRSTSSLKRNVIEEAVQEEAVQGKTSPSSALQVDILDSCNPVKNMAEPTENTTIVEVPEGVVKYADVSINTDLSFPPCEYISFNLSQSDENTYDAEDAEKDAVYDLCASPTIKMLSEMQGTSFNRKCCYS